MHHKSRQYRRYQKYMHNNRLSAIHVYCGYPGIIEVKPGHFKPSGRGHISVYLKKYCNRSVRRHNGCSGKSRGAYRKVADFWWMLT